MIRVETTVGLNNGELGGYIPNYNSCGPVIEILRTNENGYWISQKNNELKNKQQFIDKSHSKLDDLITLAHEYGHHISNEKNLRTYDYEQALKLFNGKDGLGLSISQQDLILKEEKQAWNFGREVLISFNFENLKDYDIREKDGLKNYENRFKKS